MTHDFTPGNKLAEETFTLKRANLTQYCGASQDFFEIHWNERLAKAYGLPNVIAHGMLSMATAGRVLTGLFDDPGRVLRYKTRFAAMVPVPDDDEGVQLKVVATVLSREEDTATIGLEVTLDGTPVLTSAEATLRIS